MPLEQDVLRGCCWLAPAGLGAARARHHGPAGGGGPAPDVAGAVRGAQPRPHHGHCAPAAAVAGYARAPARCKTTAHALLLVCVRVFVPPSACGQSTQTDERVPGYMLPHASWHGVAWRGSPPWLRFALASACCQGQPPAPLPLPPCTLRRRRAARADGGTQPTHLQVQPRAGPAQQTCACSGSGIRGFRNAADSGIDVIIATLLIMHACMHACEDLPVHLWARWRERV